MQKMKRLVAIMALLLMPLMTHAGEVYQSVDKFSGNTHFFTKIREPDLEGGSFFSRRYIWIDLHAFKSEANQPAPYAIEVRTFTPDWIFIASGKSLLLKLDGSEMMELSGNGSSGAREVEGAGKVDETAFYHLTLAQLTRISQAKTLDFRIFGDKQVITGSLNADFISDAGGLAANGPRLLGTVASVDGSQTGVTVTPTVAGPPSSEPLKFGVSFAQVPAPVAAAINLTGDGGVMVIALVPASVADAAGIKVGDVILKFGDNAVKTTGELQGYVKAVEPGALVPITLWRKSAEATVSAQF